MQLLTMHALQGQSAQGGHGDGDEAAATSFPNNEAASALLREEELMNQAIMLSLQMSEQEQSRFSEGLPQSGSGSNIGTGVFVPTPAVASLETGSGDAAEVLGDLSARPAPPLPPSFGHWRFRNTLQ